ncbi:TPA: hypothetical protein N0F65_001480 [Lagenidium giganteum]|uniref:25S rRNA adenine-N(1) methyltransferase n=1 Tax=Lagenidium giganteum TaxID=4803 RepID=A0AAV2Z3G6_9STRA|nr:TPA: hypothetical protein N0F65_001480 [Lagenidium giganteum]
MVKTKVSDAASAGKAKTKAKKKTRKPIHIAAPKMKSRRRARQVTTDFHRLTHELDRVAKDPSLDAQQKKAKTAELNKKLEELGGREAYQDASILSTSFHRTSKWVFQLLTKFELRPKAKQPPLRVLEVGAINTQLLSCPWLDVRAIDLVSRNEKIEQRDFFTITPEGNMDVVVSSMVLNCVPDPMSRGKMLQMYYEHLKPSGHLFLMIPLLCLRHSKFMTYDRFCDILRAVGFEIREKKDSPKVSFFCLQRASQAAPDTTKRFPQKLLNRGEKFNDFSVVL